MVTVGQALGKIHGDNNCDIRPGKKPKVYWKRRERVGVHWAPGKAMVKSHGGGMTGVDWSRHPSAAIAYCHHLVKW
jgi:hypothetical protein